MCEHAVDIAMAIAVEESQYFETVAVARWLALQRAWLARGASRTAIVHASQRAVIHGEADARHHVDQHEAEEAHDLKRTGGTLRRAFRAGSPRNAANGAEGDAAASASFHGDLATGTDTDSADEEDEGGGGAESTHADAAASGGLATSSHSTSSPLDLALSLHRSGLAASVSFPGGLTDKRQLAICQRREASRRRELTVAEDGARWISCDLVPQLVSSIRTISARRRELWAEKRKWVTLTWQDEVLPERVNLLAAMVQERFVMRTLLHAFFVEQTKLWQEEGVGRIDLKREDTAAWTHVRQLASQSRWRALESVQRRALVDTQHKVMVSLSLQQENAQRLMAGNAWRLELDRISQLFRTSTVFDLATLQNALAHLGFTGIVNQLQADLTRPLASSASSKATAPAASSSPPSPAARGPHFPLLIFDCDEVRRLQPSSTTATSLCSGDDDVDEHRGGGTALTEVQYSGGGTHWGSSFPVDSFQQRIVRTAVSVGRDGGRTFDPDEFLPPNAVSIDFVSRHLGIGLQAIVSPVPAQPHRWRAGLLAASLVWLPPEPLVAVMVDVDGAPLLAASAWGSLRAQPRYAFSPKASTRGVLRAVAVLGASQRSHSPMSLPSPMHSANSLHGAAARSSALPFASTPSNRSLRHLLASDSPTASPSQPVAPPPASIATVALEIDRQQRGLCPPSAVSLLCALVPVPAMCDAGMGALQLMDIMLGHQRACRAAQSLLQQSGREGDVAAMHQNHSRLLYANCRLSWDQHREQQEKARVLRLSQTARGGGSGAESNLARRLREETEQGQNYERADTASPARGSPQRTARKAYQPLVLTKPRSAVVDKTAMQDREADRRVAYRSLSALSGAAVSSDPNASARAAALLYPDMAASFLYSHASRLAAHAALARSHSPSASAGSVTATAIGVEEQ